MVKISWSDRFRYWSDNLMAQGSIAQIGLLGILSFFLVLCSGVFLAFFRITPEGEEPLSFFEATWSSLMHTLDSGTGGGDTGWGFRLVMLGVTLGGVFIISTLIGVLTSGIEGRIEDLRKGRSRVIESGHTVILGWSPRVFSIISELVIANESQKKAAIVILADHDKVEMEDEITDKVGDMKTTRVVCRTGDPIDLTDLEIISPHTARAIIIPSPPGEDPDHNVIKSILAITNNPHRRPEPYHIVAEIRDARNLDVARLVGREEARFVLVDDLLARLTVQASLQSGLSVVYTDLLDFGGMEIYFKEEAGLFGKTFEEALFLYEDSAIFGMRFADGRVQLLPPLATVFAAGDQVVVVAEDDSTIHLLDRVAAPIDETVILEKSERTPQPVRTLLLGWNRRAPTVIRELDNYVPAGSELAIMTMHPEDVIRASAVEHGFAQLANLKMTILEGDPTHRPTLNGLEVNTYQHVLLLSNFEAMGPQEADARTLIALLHLRDIARLTNSHFSIASEMLDMRNRDLLTVTQADDFIVSNKITSLMLSQLAENGELEAVFQDLFDVEGSELYLKPVGNYVKLGQPVNFYTVLEAARRHGELALGYRIWEIAGDKAQNYGVVVNPVKSAQVTFGANDKIVVLAED